MMVEYRRLHNSILVYYLPIIVITYRHTYNEGEAPEYFQK